MSTKTRQTVIGVIGDAQIQSERHLEVAEDLGAKLSKAGYVVASGGLSGIMEAVFRGAQNSGSKLTTKTVGILPGHDAEAANDYADVVIPTGLDIGRNSVVVHSDAVIVIGGSAGTLSEIAMAWSLYRLIIGFRVEGWSGKLADKTVDDRDRYPEIENDRVYGVDEADEALALLKELLPKYQKVHRGIHWRKG